MLNSENNKSMELINYLKNKEKIKILFVCLGNICRSPAAEEIMRSVVKDARNEDRFELDSAGLYGGHAGDLPDSRMRAHAIRRGYSLTHRSRPVRRTDFYNFDLIICMDDSNFRGLLNLAATEEEEAKIVRMTDFCRQHPYYDNVPDPYYEGAQGFELVLDLLEDGCQGLYDSLQPEE